MRAGGTEGGGGRSLHFINPPRLTEQTQYWRGAAMPPAPDVSVDYLDPTEGTHREEVRRCTGLKCDTVHCGRQ